MSNETDLDWLARNVHVWPVYVDTIHVGVGIRFGEMGWCVANIGFRKSSKITKDQWLARRAELQNKPSWKDAPEWAINLVQIASGSWVWIDSETPKMLFGSGDKFEYSGNYGLVLGDWRDTLERRPADLSEQAVTQRLQEATENVLAAVPGLKSDKYKFEPFTRIEDNQELNMSNKQDVKQDNGWFERGDLPPVGVVCETLAEPELQWVAAEVVAHREGFAIVWATSEKCGAQCDDPKHFRPIRTERELAIEEMKRHLPYPGSWDMVGRVYAEALYDAGYRKDPN